MRNEERLNDPEVNPGSDEEAVEDRERSNLLERLNSLAIVGEEEEDAQQEFRPPATAPVNERTRQPEPEVIFLQVGAIMRIIDFLQPGRTIGTGEMSQTRDLMTLQMTLPGGVQINNVELTIGEANTIGVAWDYHPGLFMAPLVASGALKNDEGYIAALQKALDKQADQIISKNGRLGESTVYTLKGLPEGKNISATEGFVSPHTFIPPRDNDPCLVSKLNFNKLDNTSNAVIITAYLLIERERVTHSVRRNRYRNVEETAPGLESLPMSMLADISQLLLESPDNNSDRMDIDSNARRTRSIAQTQQLNERQIRRRHRGSTRSAPHPSDSSASATTVPRGNTHVISDDTRQLPSLAELQRKAAQHTVTEEPGDGTSPISLFSGQFFDASGSPDKF